MDRARTRTSEAPERGAQLQLLGDLLERREESPFERIPLGPLDRGPPGERGHAELAELGTGLDHPGQLLGVAQAQLGGSLVRSEILQIRTGHRADRLGEVADRLALVVSRLEEPAAGLV